MQVPKEWQMVRLVDCTSEKPAYGANSPSIEYHSNMPRYVRITDITDNGKLDPSKRVSVQIEGNEEYTLREGDFLFARSGATVGKTYLYNACDGWAIFAGYLIRFRVDADKVLPEYLKSYTQSERYWNWVKTTIRAGAQPNINAQEYSGLQIPLPPISEQRKITDILNTWNEAIDLTEQLIAAKQRRKRSFMQRLLTGQVRFPAFISSYSYQQSNFGLIPEDWSLIKLGLILKPVSRIVQVDPQKEYNLIGVRWYGEGAHIHDRVSGSEIQTPTLNHIWEGDILYNKMWTTKGAFAIAKQAHHNSYGTNEYPQFRAIDGVLEPRYFEYVFRLPRFQHDATALCRGTTGRARLNPQDFLKLEIPLPSIKEQRKIADFIYTCTEELDLLQQKLTALRQQKQGLMQQLLTGKIRVKV